MPQLPPATASRADCTYCHERSTLSLGPVVVLAPQSRTGSIPVSTRALTMVHCSPVRATRRTGPWNQLCRSG